VRLGTRGSALALTQARAIAEALGAAELVTITTSGDRGAGEDKSRWVDAIESALVRGDIDLAVHSAKDVPGELAEGMTVAAALEREDPRDALVGASSLDELAPGSRVGTSSLRRRAQLLAMRADLDLVDMRGNVDTRLRKLADGEVDAIVLAAAGLRRLGRQDAIDALLDPAVFVPAPGQGALAVEGREVPAVLIDPATDAALRAERYVVAALGTSCHTPVGVWHDGSTLHAFVGLPDGSEWIRDAITGQVVDVAAALVARLTTVGARELLARAEAMAAA
jgi:hydroxymethylbilane synthase